MAAVEELYKNFGILADAAENASEHEDVYISILNAVKGSVPEKKLACQFIPRFAKYFTNIIEQAIDAQIDLCEDEDVLIRRQAIRSLPDFCKENKDSSSRISDVLTQLLQTEDNTEFTIVTKGLDSLMRLDPKGTLSGVFTQIVSGEETVRESAIKYLNLAVLRLMKDVFHSNPDAEGILYSEIKKVMSDVTGEEFKIFMNLLSKLKSIANNPQSLADVVAQQAELDKVFVPTENENIDRLITCTRQGIPFFLKGASSGLFFEYIMKNVFPVLSNVVSPEGGADYHLELLKLLSEISPYASEDQSKQYLQTIYDKLLEYMPLPPSEEETGQTESPEKQLNFSYVECLLFVTHQLGRQHEEFLNSTTNADRMADFKLRLQYFSRQLQTYIRQLKASIHAKADETKVVVGSSTLSQAKLKNIALRTCNNINALIKDLFRNPPTYKVNIQLSWTSHSSSIASVPSPTTAKVPVTSGEVEEKRKRAGITPVSFPESMSPSPDKKKKDSTKVYQAPRKNSSNGSYAASSSWNSGNSRRNGGRGRGRGRGRGGQTYTNFLDR